MLSIIKSVFRETGWAHFISGEVVHLLTFVNILWTYIHSWVHGLTDELYPRKMNGAYNILWNLLFLHDVN